MMGEYLIYYNCKYVAGIFDDKLLLKDCNGLKEIMQEYNTIIPYLNATKMVEIDNLKDKIYLQKIFDFLYKKYQISSFDNKSLI